MIIKTFDVALQKEITLEESNYIQSDPGIFVAIFRKINPRYIIIIIYAIVLNFFFGLNSLHIKFWINWEQNIYYKTLRSSINRHLLKSQSSQRGCSVEAKVLKRIIMTERIFSVFKILLALSKSDSMRHFNNLFHQYYKETLIGILCLDNVILFAYLCCVKLLNNYCRFLFHIL